MRCLFAYLFNDTCAQHPALKELNVWMYKISNFSITSVMCLENNHKYTAERMQQFEKYFTRLITRNKAQRNSNDSQPINSLTAAFKYSALSKERGTVSRYRRMRVCRYQLNYFLCQIKIYGDRP